MKKLVVLLFVVGVLYSLSSCKKEFTCECASLSTLTVYEKTGKGKDATEACNDAADKVLGIPIEVCVPKE